MAVVLMALTVGAVVSPAVAAAAPSPSAASSTVPSSVAQPHPGLTLSPRHTSQNACERIRRQYQRHYETMSCWKDDDGLRPPVDGWYFWFIRR
jgi:hypothetical protein